MQEVVLGIYILEAVFSVYFVCLFLNIIKDLRGNQNEIYSRKIN